MYQARPKRPKEIYLDDKFVDLQQLSPDGKYVTFRLTKKSTNKSTIVPNYVTASGFTEDISARTKVGTTPDAQEFFVYDIKRDTVLQVKTDSIPGITEVPEYRKAYTKTSADTETKKDKK